MYTTQPTASCRLCGERIAKMDPTLFGHVWAHVKPLPAEMLHGAIPR